MEAQEIGGVWQYLKFKGGEDSTVTHEISKNLGGTTFKIDGDLFTQDAGDVCEVDRDCDDGLTCKADSNSEMRCHAES